MLQFTVALKSKPMNYFLLTHTDPLTETYNFSFYLTYLAKWPEYCQMAEGPGKQAMGYILGKAEGQGELWHGHVRILPPDYCFGTKHDV